MQMRWKADQELEELIRRYYQGEAGLWGKMQQLVHAELRRRQLTQGGYHLRYLKRRDGGYDVMVSDATGYENAG